MAAREWRGLARVSVRTLGRCQAGADKGQNFAICKYFALCVAQGESFSKRGHRKGRFLAKINESIGQSAKSSRFATKYARISQI